MTIARTFPPGWHFASKPDPRRLAVGDLLAIEPEPSHRQPACANCDDHEVMYARRVTGPGRVVTWVGGARVHAELISGPCPVCQGDALDQWLAANSGLAGIELDGKPALEIRLTEQAPLPGQEAAFQAAWSLAAEIPAARTWALFSGDFGRGKTHLLCGLVNACRLARVYALYTKSERILSELRETFQPGALEDTGSIRRKYELVPALAVDELDRVKWTEWAGEQLFAILDQRHLHGRATWFASNQGPAALARTNPTLGALVSRISAGRVAELEGDDLRPAAQDELPGLPDYLHD
jgi:hypothetical protein